MDDKFYIREDLGVVSEDVELPFPLFEFKNRLNRIRKEMAVRGIDTLYLTMPESMYYVSGLKLNWYSTNSSSFWDSSKATGVAVNVDSDNFILFVIPDEEYAALGSTCSTDIRVMNDTPGEVCMFGETIKGPEEGKDPMADIVCQLKDEGWLKGTVAMEMGSPRPSWRVGEKLKNAFMEAGCDEVVDGTDVVLAIRRKKSSLELNCIERASHYADIAHQAIQNNLCEGMTERELVGIYTKAMYEAGGESMAITDQVGFGKGKTWWVHSPASRRKLLRGDVVRVDLCGVHNRYHANQGRFYSFGTPDKEFEHMCRISETIMHKVSEIIEPNMYINDFWSILIEYMKKEAMWGKQYWLGGYEIGIAFPPDWVGEFVYDAFIDAKEQRFEPGMVVNFETGFGIVDTLMFTETEGKVLGTTPWKLQVIAPEIIGE